MMKSVRKATLAGMATVVVYLSVVVITTPALEPLDGISAAFRLNSSDSWNGDWIASVSFREK